MFRGLCFLFLLGSLPHLACGDWKIINKGGEEWIASENIRSFYSFPEFEKNPNKRSVRLAHPSLDLAISESAEPHIARINGVRFRLIHPCLWDETRKDILLRVPDIALAIDPIVRPSLTPRSRKPSVVIRPNLRSFSEGDIALPLMLKRIQDAGWKASTSALDGGSPTLLIDLKIVPTTSSAELGSVSTEWCRTKRGTYGSRSVNGDPIVFATTIHSILVKQTNLQDLAIRASDPVPFESKRPARIAIVLRLPEDFSDFPSMWQAIADGLEREAASRRPANEE